MQNQDLDLNYIFVYGTLKQGEGNHRYLENSIFLGNAQVKGELLDIGPFPALLGKKDDISKPTWVQGEVYLVDNQTLARLDRLESEGSLYHRKSTIAHFGQHRTDRMAQTLAVWSYFWGSHTDYAVIKSGNWVARLETGRDDGGGQLPGET